MPVQCIQFVKIFQVRLPKPKDTIGRTGMCWLQICMMMFSVYHDIVDCKHCYVVHLRFHIQSSTNHNGFKQGVVKLLPGFNWKTVITRES